MPLFFSIFWPSVDCGVYTESDTCEATIVKVTGESLCLWNTVDLNCLLRPVPETLTFYMLVVLCMSVVLLPVLLPVLFFCDIISFRPDLKGQPHWVVWLFSDSSGEPVTELRERPSLMSGMLTKDGIYRNQVKSKNDTSAAASKTMGLSLRSLGIRRRDGKLEAGSISLHKSLDSRLKLISNLSVEEEAELLIEGSVEGVY